MGNSNGKKVDSSKESKDALPRQGLKAKQARIIVESGENHLEIPEPLLQELAIDIEQAKTALETDKNKQISKEVIEDTLTKENSDDLHNDEFYDALESDSITESQKLEIKKKVKAGFLITEIADEMEIPETKVKGYVDVTFITLSGEEGQRILEIITKNFEKYPKMKLRELIITKNVKLQEQICCQLPKKNENDYTNLRKYFMKFEESQFFFEIEDALSIEEKECIRASSLGDIEELSSKLNRIQKIIRDYFLQYYPDESLIFHYTEKQLENIKNIITTFKMDEQISHTTYRVIISDSFDNIIQNAIKPGKEPKIIVNEFLPLAFYYIKCSLPLDEFSQIIAKISNTTNMSLTTLDIFHIIFQMSDPIVRSLCIEHYSFSNPVPLYYPRFELYSHTQTSCQFEICNELWYSLQQFNGLVSFGLGWASWNPIGKSHLLDLMFETDFVKGSPQNSAFHLGSIDIQMTKNLFGDKAKNVHEPTQWAYIDCHGCSDVNVTKKICENIETALIHVSSTDFIENFTRLEQDITRIIRMTEKTQHVYLLVRDHPGNDIEKKEELIGGKKCSIIFVPHLIKQEKDLCPDLKELGYKILHSTPSGEKYVDSIFLEHLIKEFDTENNLDKEKQLIQIIIVNHISTNKESESDFSSLNFYPLFIEYMKSFYKSSNETDQKAIDELNKECGILDGKLKTNMMSEIVFHFNEILAQENSTLILWKLAQELKIRGGKYTLEIFWREALLSNKYNDNMNDEAVSRFCKEFASNFSNHVKRGEPFELIDGDNLRFFNQDIDALLSNLYQNQSRSARTIPQNKKRPPIVISIFGPQRSGKSTLLNYCFGCKFLTSAGRCTKGVYGSLSKLSRPINHSDHFLILDTEGLDSIEKGKVLTETSCIEFDRTMVLFCLAVSQVVIINVKGEIGKEMRNILHICAYSLNKLKVSKVSAPKIFFVLNQQADPDPQKHLSSINILLEDLNRGSDLMETDGLTISELIQVSSENLFVLPPAFNSVCVNSQMAKLFDSDLNKLSPTVSFANECADLRMSIIQQLNDDPPDNQIQFTTMSEWMKMSGVIWDTIVKYQDIVKYRNVEELKCSIILSKLISDLLERKIYSNQGEYRQITENLIQIIKKIEKWNPPKGILEEVKEDLDKIFKKYQEEALTKFAELCKADPLLKKLNYMCDDAKSNLNRLIFMEKKIYEDKLRLEIKVRLTEIKISEEMTKFQEAIEKNADQYLELNSEQQEREFTKIWANCFGSDKKEEEGSERDEMFDNLYSVFRIESKTMENKQTIYSHFRDFNFDMDNIIQTLRGEILTKFCEEPSAFAGTEQFLYPWKENKVPLKDMTPYIGRIKCDYLTMKSLWISSEVQNKGRDKKHNLKFQEWVPLECHSLIQYCSGHYNHPDVVWNLEKRKQILLLASQLKDPNNFERSTWDKFISDIATRVEEFIENDPNISHSTVKEIVGSLCNIIRVVNYEINYIEAKLTNTAERTISTFAFAFAFKSLLRTKTGKQRETKLKFNEKKDNDLKYFLREVENRKMARGNWDRKKMRIGDQTMANKFAGDLLEAVLRSVKTTCEQNINEDYFNEKKDKLSHKSLLLLANKKITKELSKTIELNPITEDNFVVQFICNQNRTLNNLFKEEWLKVANELHDRIVENIKEQFTLQISTIRAVLAELLDGIIARCKSLDRPDGIGFDSDSNFVVAGESSTKEFASMTDPKAREAPLKSMVLFLQMYLNPKVTPKEFNQFFNNSFKIDGVKIEKNRKDYVLYEKTYNPTEVLTEELFKKLIETKMFSSSETIFNIKIYGEEFLSTLKCYEFQVSQTNYEKLLKATKEEFETRVINCPYQCPSCGKFCEREIHPHEGKCQIMTGHQLFSMGGKVWNTNEERTAILLMCEDYRDDSPVLIPGQNMKWWEFKEKCGYQWDWSLPNDTKYVALQKENREKMKNIWNKFGKEILQYYANKGTQIKYIPFTTSREIYESLLPFNYYVCFVIDGTNLMSDVIIYVKQRVSDLMRDFEGASNFKVIVYHGDCSNEVSVEKFPNNSDFTSDKKSIQDFFEKVKTNGDEDNEFPMLHGLATATKECEWKSDFGFKNTIVHIYVEPTQGYFDFHTATGKCEKGCQFDWKRDISDIMEQFKIEYKKSRYINKRHPDYSASVSLVPIVNLNSDKDCKPKSAIFYFKPDN